MMNDEEKREFQSGAKGKFRLYKQANCPFYTVRLQHQGRRRAFSTGETTLKGAKSKAAAMVADIKSRGFDEAIKLHGRRKENRTAGLSDPTIGEFVEIYRDVSRSFERQPSPPTSAYYIRCLERICQATRCRKLVQLKPEKIENFRITYLKEAASAGRSDAGARTSMNSILRNAKALFSREAMDGYKRLGLDFTSPFAPVRLHRVRLKPYSPLSRDLLDLIWRDASLLRDGDPAAPEPISASKQKQNRKKTREGPESHSEKYARLNFQLPNPGAYLLLLLELGLGLRRNEADKAQWDWLHQRENGRWFLEVRETQFFRPKSRERRILPVEPDLYEELIKFKGGSRFIVPGRELKKEDAEKVLAKRCGYRADRHHRTLSLWLRKKGVNDDKPCHLLRKEFGSYVATSFGLFHAQKFLGHSTPVVTDAYYAGLTDIPELRTVHLQRTDKAVKEHKGEDLPEISADPKKTPSVEHEV